ncbi:hypothetical protein H2200_008674 [Cladophialophora chaetospira]|uniref:Alpha/beta hydrolase fold-3 domain-containing protein n=1 Tax=Cladophialophora chaetospira TaxID=386627 RepID=A0AA38X4I1_9EURO|nr:hypothetical protein H2200_008674 [Cladophialophora chaetospira]
MDFSRYGSPSTEWQEFARTHTILPTGLAPGQTPAQLRDATNLGRETVSAANMKASKLDQKVSWSDHQVSTSDGDRIPIRVYRSNDADADMHLPAYIFYHGGGFLFGSISSEDAACSRIAAETHVAVVNVCYRHTPDFKHPTQHNDAWEAFEWIDANAENLKVDRNKLIVGGISAGGGLACSVAVRHIERANHQTSKPRAVIRGQLLCIPWLIHRDAYPFHRFESQDKSSYRQCAGAPVLPMAQLNLFADLLECNTPNDVMLMSVGNMSDDMASRLPKTVLITAGNDTVRDDGLMMATMLQAQS